MLNVTSISSASDAQKYFEQDNYYSHDEGYAKSYWGGQGAEVLGLQGNVKAESFTDLLEGKIGAQELGRDRVNPETEGSPAFAGIGPIEVAQGDKVRWFPRVRGDRPEAAARKL